MSNIEQLKEAAREKYWEKIHERKPELLPRTVNGLLDEIVTSTYLQAVKDMKVWTEGAMGKYGTLNIPNGTARNKMIEHLNEIEQSLKQTKDV